MTLVLATVDNEVSPLLPHSRSQYHDNWSRDSPTENEDDNDDHIENFREDNNELSQDTQVRKRLEQTLLRKVDIRMSILVLIYILNYIDRNNVAAARLRGFEEDLGLSGTQFSSILSSLYVGYIIMQIPSNMLLNWMGKPSLYLSCCMILWGSIMSCLTGVATSYFGALCSRFVLGFFETAFFPGALFLISKWYKRDELSQRTAYLSSGSLIANGTGSLIASGILSALDNALNVAAWRWLFFVEGGLTVVVAIGAMIILPDFPETSSGWLSPAEKALAIRRMQEEHVNTSSSHDDTPLKTQLNGLSSAISDPKVWWLAATQACLTFSLSFNAYMPTIVREVFHGYNPTTVLLLCAPPFFVATAVAITISRHSDKAGERCGHITFTMVIGIIGFTLVCSTTNTAVRYFSLFLMAQSYAGFICFLAWSSSSVSQTPAKRAVALALMNTVGTLGNVLGPYIWPTTWGPTYSQSFVICAIANVLGIVMCWMFRRHLVHLNTAAAKRETLHNEIEGYRYFL
ncbi:major facilitator superfamily domain-containing protein [Rhodocollybia butyracea]|uniref:Major facilitator superfamily domain-containing protein n=1 Tax=Rhodocollybia butyracea TaxID=206335 RepID=A0A9P5Q8W7_9AGAR|nr:major facilitator superfamily domain-containing protein [Rhodocollybia butyracea]